MKKSFEKKRTPSAYKHDLGQNFIYDKELLASLVAATGIGPEDDVLEIGTGAGTLTECLCETANHVVSVEVDHDLIPVLRLLEQRMGNLTLVEGDIRRQNFDELTAELKKPLYVIANIPYNITTPIVDMLLEHRQSVREIDLMVQKEVADKMMACPSDDLYGILSLKCQYYCSLSVLQDVPAGCFTPPPKVDSAFISMRIHQEPACKAMDEKQFFTLVKTAFGMRRKTLVNGLKGTPCGAAVPAALEVMGLPATVRAEELNL